MSAKATHMGECQICGRKQKLPSGKLSKHGYTKTAGFFEGTCEGADQLPFEQSKDLCAGAVLRAERLLQVHTESSARWKTGPIEPGKAWDYVYVESRPYRRGHYVWQLVEIIERYGEWDEDGTTHRYSDFKAVVNGREQRVGDVRSTMESICRTMNTIYAERAIDPVIREIERYIVWQNGRMLNWKPRRLKPIQEG